MGQGVAGNLGVSGVETAARALETACEEQSQAVEELLAEVVTELQPVLAVPDELASKPGQAEDQPEPR